MHSRTIVRRAAGWLSLGLALFATATVAGFPSELVPRADLTATVTCQPDALLKADPALGLDFLRQPGEQRPSLTIGYYDEDRGLLAGYQSSRGKRILLRARWLNGNAIAEVAHLSESGKIEGIIGPHKKRKPNGKIILPFEVAGTELLPYLDAVRASRGVRLGGRDPMSEFLLRPEGKAFAEAVPALYATLEQLDRGALSRLQAPFGAVLAAL